jgi:hypothetical protein
MTVYKKDCGILHVIYDNIIPKYLIDIANIYEGEMKDRIGLNFPVSFLYKKEYKDLKEIKEAIKNAKDTEYVIVYKNGDKNTKMHELMHAKYYMDENYKKNVDEMWENLSEKSKTKVIGMLKKMGYDITNMNIVIDEFQAYYKTEKSNFFGKI